MLRTRYAIVAALVLLSALVSPIFGGAPTATPKAPAIVNRGVEGVWGSRTESPLSSETILFRFTKQSDGKLTATVDILEARRQEKLTNVSVKDDVVEIRDAGAKTIFEAKVSEDGKRLEGKIGRSRRPIRLVRLDEVPELRRPQEPTKPYPYDEEEVTFRNKEIRFSGTLTLPRAGKPHAAVVLLSGSQPDDRNYTAAGHYPFLVLADYLTRRGIAVLRFDDRGVGKSTGDFSQATTADLADDARAAVEFLKSRKDIDAKRIGLIGHSDGASGAALVAVQMPETAFIVMLGGAGVPGDQVILRQSELLERAIGSNEHLVQWTIDIHKGMVEILKNEPDVARADQALRRQAEEVNAALTEESRRRMGVAPTFALNGQVGSTRWLHYFVNTDPRLTLAKVRCPVLALNGDKDLIVWSKDNLPAIEQALKDGGNKDFTVRELPDLNHMFQTCKTGAPAEYFLIEETIAPSALELVGDWIVHRTGATAR